jgi:hypothetical protein
VAREDHDDGARMEDTLEEARRDAREGGAAGADAVEERGLVGHVRLLVGLDAGADLAKHRRRRAAGQGVVVGQRDELGRDEDRERRLEAAQAP